MTHSGAAAVVLLLVSRALSGDDWPPGTGGHSDRNGLSSEHGPTAPEVLWDTCGDGSYCPDSPNTRGQMAVFPVKAFGLLLYGP